MNCRHCDSELKLQLADLGSAPPSNAYLTEEIPPSIQTKFEEDRLIISKAMFIRSYLFSKNVIYGVPSFSIVYSIANKASPRVHFEPLLCN